VTLLRQLILVWYPARVLRIKLCKILVRLLSKQLHSLSSPRFSGHTVFGTKSDPVKPSPPSTVKESEPTQPKPTHEVIQPVSISGLNPASYDQSNL